MMVYDRFIFSDPYGVWWSFLGLSARCEVALAVTTYAAHLFRRAEKPPHKEEVGHDSSDETRSARGRLLGLEAIVNPLSFTCSKRGSW